MDEIWFRLSNQLEVLQIKSCGMTQQIYQLLMSWLSHGQQLLGNLSNEQYNQYIKNFGTLLLIWYQRALEQIQYQYYCAQINLRDVYRQLGSLCSGEVIFSVNKRDVAVCMVGITIGGFIGYGIGRKWRQYTNRIQCMKAIICHHYIGAEGVSIIDDAEMPTLRRSNDVLVQVKATSVNIIDVKICSGYSRAYRKLLNSGQQKELPVVLGRDCAGIVVDIGRNVTSFDVGDEVFLAIPSWAPGTMTEYLVVTESQLAKKPKLISFEASACLPYSGCIAWNALVNESGIEEGNAKGRRVLIYGGTTPVGCILIQLVKLWGGHVTTVCKIDAAKVIKALGADDIIPVQDLNVIEDLEFYDKFHSIFYTGDQFMDHHILKKRLMPYGTFVSTAPKYLVSDSLGFVSGSIFAGYVRIKLLFQYVFGYPNNQWNDGACIKSEYLEILRELVDADQLQSVVGAAFRPNHIEQALCHVTSSDAIGSTIIKFQ
ncbi:hypothetical protein PV327_003896 [Microctonus hyperodae]|uniref:Enoyl reductase (ER) domain-containing protein n=1 Tax=Microctonus hyperodae TaxID=165561 RepID=A0AA39G5F0_MICHY|nr:hypothetical protein PV327_003896 [Microctonus hyperodae]